MSILGTAALISAGVGAVQTIGGFWSRRRAERNLKETPPEMPMPEGVKRQLEIARMDVPREMPGLRTARDEIGAVTGRGVEATTRGARTAGDVQAATRNLYAEEMRQLRGLHTESARYRQSMEDRRRQMMTRAEGQRAGVEMKQYEISELMPYQQRMQMYMEQAGMGGQAMVSGIGTMAGAAMQYMGAQHQSDMMDKWINRPPQQDTQHDYPLFNPMQHFDYAPYT